MKALVLVCLAALTMSFSGCERNTDTVVPANAEQLTGNWTLLEADYPVTLLIERGMQTWEREPDKAFRLSGESSVNLYTTTLTYKDPAAADITIGPVSSTKRAGPPEALAFELTYFNRLQAVTRYELTSQNRLRLFYTQDNERGVLVYEKR
ncbi:MULTISPECIES: META domain-containing protein [Spirosoma]|uniref:META domain-containing protein n=1 Tax=Spirosoma sordidisoli TaxID=2502893 RepID=A0A4Q2UG17_9BACT|nr:MULTISPECIES: META domain-containing protein [Spirosoma]RYC68293.1 META domain-containing protein [Spirosoma sordidisoli]